MRRHPAAVCACPVKFRFADLFGGFNRVNPREKDNPIVYVTITELKPVRSRIEKLKLEMAA